MKHQLRIAATRTFRLTRLFVGATAALAALQSCGEYTAPSPRMERPDGPSFTISGTVTAGRMSPLDGAGVSIYPCQGYWAITCGVWTDVEGHYTISSPGAAPTTVTVVKAGYEVATKENVTADASIVNFALQPIGAVLQSGGGTVSATISGDEFMAGDDVYFHGMCERVPCKVIQLTEFAGGPRPVELRLRWADPTHQLALYKFDGNVESLTRDSPALRFCCSSATEVVANVKVQGYFDVLAVAFEQAAGGLPDLGDTEPFELTLRPTP